MLAIHFTLSPLSFSQANVDQCKADTGDTPLILASSQGHLSVAKLLLEHAADPDLAATDDGGNPILYAAQEVVLTWF